jgi:hypothetical protein
MRLSEEQLRAVESLDWFCGENRRTGRTVAQAVWVIRHALENPNQSVMIKDHYQWTEMRPETRHLRSLFLDTVQGLIPPELGEYFQLGRESIVYTGSRIEKWLPDAGSSSDFSSRASNVPEPTQEPVSYWDLL